MQLFLDCDGVLANFDARFEELAGEPARGFEDKNGTKAFWHVVAKDKDFFANLPLMPGAKELVAAVRHLNPIILTGTPVGDWSQPQKQYWRHKNFPDLPMITCLSKDKLRYMIPGKKNVIVDDWPKHQAAWEAAGGIWVAHTSAEDSIRQLTDLGIL